MYLTLSAISIGFTVDIRIYLRLVISCLDAGRGDDRQTRVPSLRPDSTVMRAVLLDSRAKISAVLHALRKSAVLTTVRVLRSLGKIGS